MVTLQQHARAHIFSDGIVNVFTKFGEERSLFHVVWTKNHSNGTNISFQIWHRHHHSVSCAFSSVRNWTMACKLDSGTGFLFTQRKIMNCSSPNLVYTLTIPSQKICAQKHRCGFTTVHVQSGDAKLFEHPLYSQNLSKIFQNVKNFQKCSSGFYKFTTKF